MKKILFAFVLIASVTVHAQHKTGIIYDDNAQKRKVPAFSAINISNAIDLYLTQSNSNEVAVSAANDETRDQIITEVEGGTLIIKMNDRRSIWNWKKWGDSKAKAYVSIKQLNAIIASGACNVHIINTIETPRLKLKLNGASDLKGDFQVGSLSAEITGASEYKGTLKASTVSIVLSGASNVDLSGITEDLSVKASGASDAELFKLDTKGAIVEVTGASSAKVTASQLYKLSASGASSIEYKGDAVVKEVNNTGASSVKHRN
jgi:hypothetical protein